MKNPGPERIEWWDWYLQEVDYADNKFGDQRAGHDAAMLADGFGPDGFWFRQVFQYADRARLFGMDTLQGRQALAKLVMTAMGAVESAIRVHGHMPKPGLSSGYIEDWAERQTSGSAGHGAVGEPRTPLSVGHETDRTTQNIARS